jgi:inner membrane protein
MLAAVDPLTHCLLGAATASAIAGPRIGRAALLLGAAAGELPDLDVVIPTDPALPMEWHRHFTHALAVAPAIGSLAALPFLAAARFRRDWTLVLAAAIAAATTHGILDMCTSYGTYWLWPFIDRRLAWDVISIIDPIFTVALLAGVTWSLIAARPRPVRAALAACLAYLVLGVLQHHRAAAVQRGLAEARGDRVEHGRVMPTLGNLVLWRSVYRAGGRVHADAVRAAAPGTARALGGASLPAATPDDLPYRAAEDPGIARVLDGLHAFADGFTALHPDDPRVVGDMRYSLVTGGFEPLWGIKVELAGTRPVARWVFLGGDRRAAIRRIWSDLAGSAGLAPDG